MPSKNILMVEDDRALSNGITLALKSDDFILSQAHSISSTAKALSVTIKRLREVE